MVANDLDKTGGLITSRAMMYRAVVQLGLLYGSKIWVVMDAMMVVLEVFHHRIARRIAGMIARKGVGGKW